MHNLAARAMDEREHTEKELLALRLKAMEQDTQRDALNTRSGAMITELSAHVADIDALLRRQAYMDVVSRVHSLMFGLNNNDRHYVNTVNSHATVRRCSMLRLHRRQCCLPT